VRSTESIKSTVPLLVLEQWPIDRLRPYEHNPRKNDKAVNQIRASIREFRFCRTNSHEAVRVNVFKTRQRIIY
jgi:hypothetical protein